MSIFNQKERQEKQEREALVQMVATEVQGVLKRYPEVALVPKLQVTEQGIVPLIQITYIGKKDVQAGNNNPNS